MLLREECVQEAKRMKCRKRKKKDNLLKDFEGKLKHGRVQGQMSQVFDFGKCVKGVSDKSTGETGSLQ